jgi:hypothetical protein
MPGTNVKTWSAGELQRLVDCELVEAQEAIATLGATAPKDDLLRKVMAIRRAKALVLAARKMVAEKAAKASVEPEPFDEEPDAEASVPRP